MCSFENALVEKSESSTRNKNGLVEGLPLFSVLDEFYNLPPTSTVQRIPKELSQIGLT